MDRRAFSKSIVSGLALTASGLSLKTLAAVLDVEDGVSECYSCDGFKQLVGQRYKLITNDSGKTFELYDLLEDPGETADIAAGHPDRVADMKTALTTWRNACRHSDKGEDY